MRRSRKKPARDGDKGDSECGSGIPAAIVAAGDHPVGLIGAADFVLLLVAAWTDFD